MKKIFQQILSTTTILSLCACSSAQVENTYPKAAKDIREERGGKLTGEGGVFTFGGDKKHRSDGGVLGVNSYLWRAALDTVSFMPITAADPFGGTIITDWYEDPKAPRERFKLNIFIFGGVLRTDAIKVTVFKQTLTGNALWRDASVNEKLGRDLEDKILTKARQLRINQPK